VLGYTVSADATELCGGVVAGVRGTGKSLFAGYVMAHFVNDTRLKDRRIAFEY
jgi:Cdc6-like AAA superfamily ATPase